ncbi:hypothetical protein BDR26DRAFT_1004771 [Obelidium mucronatum]|nr:hypothetical protein BDR26DRAFT_1004771 [Obelidium mucronatum]
MDRFAFGRPQTPTKPRLLEALSAANASTDETQSQSQNLNLNQSQNQNLNQNPNPTPSSPFWNRVFPWSVTVASAVAGSPKSPLRQVFMKAESEASARLAAHKTLRRAHSALHAAPKKDAAEKDAEKDASPQIPPAAERHEHPTKALECLSVLVEPGSQSRLTGGNVEIKQSDDHLFGVPFPEKEEDE